MDKTENIISDTTEVIPPVVETYKSNKAKVNKYKVVAKTRDKAVIVIDNFGVSVKSNAKVGDEITVSCTGKIGTPNFKVEVVK